MTAYVRAPFAVEEDEDGLWAAPLPAGPVTRLTGAAPLILELVPDPAADASDGIDAAQVAEALRLAYEDVPGDLEAVVEQFLDERAAGGFIRDAQSFAP